MVGIRYLVGKVGLSSLASSREERAEAGGELFASHFRLIGRGLRDTVLTMDTDAAERRRQILESLKQERQRARASAAGQQDTRASADALAAPAIAAAAASVEDAEQRKADREELVQKLRSERQGGGTAPAKVRTAWSERIDGQTAQLERELGVLSAAASSSRAATRGSTSAALERAALDAVALQADAIDLGALGSAELDAIAKQAAAELDGLGARGASALGTIRPPGRRRPRTIDRASC